MCLYPCVYLVCVSGMWVPKEAKVMLDLLKLEVQVVMSCVTWVLGPELWSFGKATNALNC